MDILYWTKLNPKIIQETTTKQYFGKYLYKIVLNVPGGRAINIKNDESIAIYLNERISAQRTYNYGGSWANHKLNELHQSNPEHLSILKDIKETYRNEVKFRVEEPWMQIYAESEDMLKVIAVALGEDLQKKIVSISAPKAGTESALKSDKILVKSDKTPYKYKVMFRDGLYPVRIRNQILDYISNADVECKVSRGTKKMFSEQHSYIWGCFFYTNDLGIVTFIKLINPDIIGKIHELEHIGQ